MPDAPSPRPALDPRLVKRLFERGNAARWGVPIERFEAALSASVVRAHAGGNASAKDAERYLNALHLEDLALACACAEGCSEAWDHFVLQYRPALYRAADALDPSGGAREIADSLYGELFGLDERNGERRSLLRYFHGRSSLATWLRAVLSQRHVDRIRSARRLEALPDDDPPAADSAPDPDRTRYLALMSNALARAVARLADRDRLRLAMYYQRELTLAEVGRVLHEHEATVSRQLAKARAAIRKDVEHQLGTESGLDADEVARCFAAVTADAGPLDLRALLGSAACKPAGPERSI